MPRKVKDMQKNPYYINHEETNDETIDDIIKRKKAKERQKRIEEKKNKEEFGLETETVIQMTNRNNLKKEEEKRRKITKQEKKRKKKIKRIKFFLKLFLLIAIIVGGTVFAFTSPIFNIKDIKVTNNSQITSDTIISLSGLKTEEDIFKFYKNDVVNKIKENPYVDSAEVHRKLPSTIEIDVTERVPAFSVDYMGKYAYINTQGYILEISEDSKRTSNNSRSNNCRK